MVKWHITTVHEGNKKFECDICNSGFGKRVSFIIHVRMSHERKKPFKCDCNSNFGEKGILKGNTL